MVEIRRAVTAIERDAVYRFRYSVYCVEMGLSERWADHTRRTILDPLDGPSAVVWAAWNGDQVVGSVRLNKVSHGEAGDYLAYYRLDRLSAERQAVASISTRMMVAPAFRRTPLSARLACTSYEWGVRHGVLADYCDCAPATLPFFRKLGYRVEFDDFAHPEFGPGLVLRLDTHDLEHLTQIRSPFRRVLAARLAAGGRV